MASWTSNTIATASLTAARNTATLSERILRLHLPQCGFRCVTRNTWELLGSTSTSQAARERKVKYLVDLVRNDDVICLQETHGKDEYLQALLPMLSVLGLFGNLFTQQRQC